MRRQDPVKLVIPPGIVKDTTNYSAAGRFIDANRIRWINATTVQPIKGCVKAISSTFLGICRALFGWASIDGDRYMAIGTNKKYYVESGGTLVDITPIRSSSTINNNPFASTNGSGVVTVTDTSHGALAGDYVTYSGATAFNNLTTGDLNKEHEILTVVDANTYTINTGGTANASSSGGGASVVAAYQLNTGGSSTAFTATGYSAGAYSREGYGDPYTGGIPVMGEWSQDQWGEDLAFCPRYGKPYYYDVTTPTTRAVAVSSLGGASNVPDSVTFFMVDGDAKHAIAFGTSPYGSATRDPLTYRGCSQGDIADWDTTSTTNTAFENRLTRGTEFMCAIAALGEILAFTDTSIYSLQYLGPPDIYSQKHISSDHPIMSSRTLCASASAVYWWGKKGFWRYNGTVQEIPCTLKEWVSNDMDPDTTLKSFSFYDSLNNEVWHYYQSRTSTTGDVDKYVKYNIALNCWDNGIWNRTAWEPQDVFGSPRATDETGRLLSHETGIDDGATGSPLNMGSYIQTGPAEIGDGGKAMRVEDFWPDIGFDQSTSGNPTVELELIFRNRPGESSHTTYTATIQGNGSNFTDSLDVGKRGRSVEMRVETSSVGTFWTLGTNRANIFPAGGR